MNYVDSDAFSAFILHQGIKLHFETTYNFFKYHGKVPFTPEMFERRKDKYSYYKLSRKYKVSELRDFYVANFIHGDCGSWAGNLSKQEAIEWYTLHKRTNQSLTYTFKEDILKLLDHIDKPTDLLVVPPNGYPKLLTFFLDDLVTIETITIMNDLMGFMSMWSKNITDDVYFPKVRTKILKYSPFMEYDKYIFKKVLVKEISHLQLA